jgi:hypothetical protein
MSLECARRCGLAGSVVRSPAGEDESAHGVGSCRIHGRLASVAISLCGGGAGPVGSFICVVGRKDITLCEGVCAEKQAKKRGVSHGRAVRNVWVGWSQTPCSLP